MMVRPDSADERARRRSRGVVPPLALLAVVFVLPTIRACDRVDSPLSYAARLDVLPAMMIWPLFAIAAALALFTLSRPGGPHRRSDRGVLFAPVLTWATSLPSMAITVGEAIPKGRTFGGIAVPVLALAIALPLSIVSFRRALRATGWIRWWQALRSFAAASWLTFPVQWISMCFVDRARGLEPGAYVLVAAMLWLSAAAARRG